MYKVVVCDLDGTLITGNNILSTLCQKVFKRLNEKGIAVFLATGRHYNEVKYLSADAIEKGCLISENGARIHTLQGKCIQKKYIEQPILKEILNLARTLEPKLITHVYLDNQWYISQTFSNHRDIYFSATMRPKFCDLLSLVHETSVVKIFFHATEDDVLEKIRSKMEAHISSQSIHITYSMKDCLEVMAKGVDKGNALQTLTEIYHFSMTEVMAFGDGQNDYGMLSKVGKGLVMGNADDRLKSALPYLERVGTVQDGAVENYLMTAFDLKL